ncbi:FeoA family protein [uncultured Thiohalocapsa sp.]|uniref:FeoA family protein n=1 Tax=uncultured Thiohalocapsa sp. TaxID=768990 RepID=UPI0025FB08A3|nr:FeoA family protein [uncultured Thiohalocapsa sp.]
MQQPVSPTINSVLRPDAVDLGRLPPGVTARLEAIQGGRHLQRKLSALGLRVGSELRVEHRRGRGLVVAAGASRVALGSGIVDKLVVVPLPPAPERGHAAPPAG